MTVATGSTSRATPAPPASQRSQRNASVRNDALFDDQDIDTPSQNANAGINDSTSSQAPAAEQEVQLVLPRSAASTLKPMIGSYIPHVDLMKAGLQYITDSSVEYEEFHGSANAKGAGDKESKRPVKKPAGRSKAVLAAFADQQAFSSDPQIHEMEDALHTLVEMQFQAEAERMALDSLANTIGLGGHLPGKDLQTSFEILLKNEIKHQQARRKQNLKVAATPGGIDRELHELRTKIWEVHHAHDPLPTSAGVSAGGAEDEDEDDMEIVMTGVGGSSQSLKCPITTNYLEEPVTSSVCKHSYSKEAIMSLIRSRGGHQCRCPVHGCSSIVGAEMLHPNKALARKVARQKLIQEEMVEHQDEEYTTVDD
ncbi:E3 SUMO-protein ligase NSE2 [Entomortierella parvispora]|uniref:E3 SUMO-protein ligase NSE2 n=1 Tax=Entomortierella parvispora TaxID=205924 RepID=A0A9P3HIW8_9FUNG|nr:E3 SUMO-protein ligase NSE2 [Entomortierella parvispora]